MREFTEIIPLKKSKNQENLNSE